MLREYQQRAIDDLRRSIASGCRAPVLVAPTGSGKTAIAAEMIRSAREKGRAALFLAPRRELIYQTAERLERVGVEHGIIMAGEEGSLMPSVQVASIPTLHARAMQRGHMELPNAQLVLIDEAHLGVGGRSQEIIECYKQTSIVIGLTATPARVDGRGLGMIYDDLVEGPTVAELTELGYLAPARYFVGSKPDVSGVKVQAGDYQQRELGERASEPTLIGDVVTNWLRLAADRQTFVFAVNVAHSRHLCSRFLSHGIAAEHVDGKTPLEDRKAIRGRLWSGETQVVVNCQVYTYGVDYPPVSCIVLAAPTKSITKYLQCVGRGLRTFDGKQDCRILDHAGAVEEIGFADDPMPWSLDGKSRVQDRKQSDTPQPKDIECPACHIVFRAQPDCPACGHRMQKKFEKAIYAYECELEEIDRRTRKRNARVWSQNEKARFFGELKYHAREKGYKPGWAVNQYKSRIGVLPWPVYNAQPVPPSAETRAWIRHKQIQWAKRRTA